MSQQVTENDTQVSSDPLAAKIIAQINEEKLVKDHLANLQLSRLKTFDELAAALKDAGPEKSAEARKLLSENLSESAGSLVSRYILGGLEVLEQQEDESGHLRSLLGEFIKSGKWTIVDHIADLILEHDEKNRAALRAKVDSTERLKGKKELRPFLERLAQIDRKNPDVVKKYALSILEEDADSAVSYLKQAGETYARLKDYKNLEEVWNLVVERDHKDMPFFERIERILVGNRERVRMAAYLVSLVDPYKNEENWDAVITILKKILEYEPTSSRARSDLVRAYRSRFETHSLLNEFLKMSDLTNHKKAVGPCIAHFERNIVFDKDNYVYHRTRGVGKITEIDKDQVIVDFRDNPGQRMSIQMAISSLQPLYTEHIWVRYYENPGEIEEIFKEDTAMFFEMMLSSFRNKMIIGDVKTEIVPRFLELKDWSKWWTKTRAQLKKDPKFGFNPRKKDELLLRETPITLSEEMSMRFQSTNDWNKRLEIALETLKDQDTEGAAELGVQFYRENESNKDALKQLHSYLFLELASQAMGEDISDRKLKKSQVQEVFKNAAAADLVKWCAESPTVEFKREIVSLVIHNRQDYQEILGQILFEVPIKINRYVLTELNRLEQFEALGTFLKRTFTKYRDYPEIFLWVAKSILTEQWKYEWVEKSKEDVLLLIFRLLKTLVNIEKKGTRLKNTAIESIFGATNITVEAVLSQEVLAEVIKNAELRVLRRMYALFRDVPYAADAHKENFFEALQQLRPDFNMDSDEEEDAEVEQAAEIESLFPQDGVILASPDALEKRKAHLDHLINVVMPANSRDIGEAQEKGDLRENAEYKAAMEKQSQLQAEIQVVSDEVKRARAIKAADVRTDLVSIGSKVTVKTNDGETITYDILGPWDADAEQNRISYESPIAIALIGKKAGESASLSGDSSRSFQIEAIASAL